ncbi:MAG: 2-phospho-L-lactate guanylyltransferase [Alphaproteobacteria bacterium]
MSIWALVPQKALADVKRRLSPLLSDEARCTLARLMLADVLATLRSVKGLSGIAVVTPDRSLVPDDMLAIDDPGAGLNAALGHGAEVLEQRGARVALIVPSDVPLATAAEIESILEAGWRTPIVIVPDRHHHGTNAIFLPLPAPMPFRFGADSCAEHIASARMAGLATAALPLPGLGFDIDEPNDVSDLARRAPGRYASLLPRLQVAS